jgi:hypothetical protein
VSSGSRFGSNAVDEWRSEFGTPAKSCRAKVRTSKRDWHNRDYEDHLDPGRLAFKSINVSIGHI